MTDGFATGLTLGFLVWVAIIWWHRSRLAKADKVWMDAIKATQHSTWAASEPQKVVVYGDSFNDCSPRMRALQAQRAVDAALKKTKKRTKKRK